MADELHDLSLIINSFENVLNKMKRKKNNMMPIVHIEVFSKETLNMNRRSPVTSWTILLFYMILTWFVDVPQC